MIDPLLLAHPPTTYSSRTSDDDDETPFEAYCIVCDRRIVAPERPGAEGAAVGGKKKTSGKKKAGGTIYLKNPDGTTTARNANGKVTRPTLKRNPNSAARVAVTNAAKMQPLTRSKTADAATAPLTTAEGEVGTPGPKPECSPSPVSTPLVRPEPFYSPIYCSQACMSTDAGRSAEAYKDIARTLSFEFSHAFHSPESEVVHGHHGAGKGAGAGAGGSPYGGAAPPSPLCVSGSDTESSASGSHPAHAHPPHPPHGDDTAASAPKVMDYFRMSKEGPDEAWHAVLRQRRASMQPGFHRPGPAPTAGPLPARSGAAGESSESLASMWYPDEAAGRSTSGGGRLRAMTPVYGPAAAERERRASAASAASAASGGVFGSWDNGVPIPTRPMPRSNLSHTSLASSQQSTSGLASGAGTAPAGVPIPPEFGSAPNHTLNLLHSYAAAFPVRSSCNTPNSYQRGFVFPESSSGSAGGSSVGTPMSLSGSATGGLTSAGVTASLLSMSPSAPTARRPSLSASATTSSIPSALARSAGGTIKAKAKKPDVTWDSFGKEAVDVLNRRMVRRASGAPGHGVGAGAGVETTPTQVGMQVRRERERGRGRYATGEIDLDADDGDGDVDGDAPAAAGHAENTPKQSLERESGGWKIRYLPSSHGSPAPSTHGVDRRTTVRSKSRGSASGSFAQETYHPHGMYIPRPALSTSVTTGAVAFGSHTPSSRVVGPAPNPPRSVSASGAGMPDMAGLRLTEQASTIVPRPCGFNWEESKVPTYEIPGKIDRSQKGLFYFQ
ncbi:hypothetical protein IAT38_006918 [Cryptococcus sp. DSM 104549]